jgi:hypothetical protein
MFVTLFDSWAKMPTVQLPNWKCVWHLSVVGLAHRQKIEMDIDEYKRMSKSLQEHYNNICQLNNTSIS